MEELLQKSTRLIRLTKESPRRYLFDQISWDNRLIGIKGARGTDKSSILLQRLQQMGRSNSEASYSSMICSFFLILFGILRNSFISKGGSIYF